MDFNENDLTSFEELQNKANLDGPLQWASATLAVVLLSLKGITDNEHNRLKYGQYTAIDNLITGHKIEIYSDNNS